MIHKIGDGITNHRDAANPEEQVAILGFLGTVGECGGDVQG